MGPSGYGAPDGRRTTRRSPWRARLPWLRVGTPNLHVEPVTCWLKWRGARAFTFYLHRRSTYTARLSVAVTSRPIPRTLGHLGPRRDADELMEEAVATAARADAAILVVATTESVESEGADRRDMRLPGRQDELVTKVASANNRTVVVVNAGSPVEMPWREDVSAILLTWFPGQETGAALADVIFGDDWEYQRMYGDDRRVSVEIRNTGRRRGRDVCPAVRKRAGRRA